MSVDAGHLWIAERLGAGPHEGSTRVDGFDASGGQFLPPQLDEEGGVSFLQTGVAVGHAGGEEQVYVGAGQEGQGVVAAFDPATGKLQHAWTGAGTPNKSFTQSEGERAGVLTGVAVDGSASLETGGDMYVSTFGFIPSFNVVDVLKPEPGGEEPAKATAHLVGTCATDTTFCRTKAEVQEEGEKEGKTPDEIKQKVKEAEEEGLAFTAPSGVAVSAFNSEVLVTDGERVVDVFRPTLLGEYEFVRQLKGTPTGPLESEAPFESIVAVAADGTSGNVYVADQAAHAIDEFDAQGRYLGRLTRTPAGPFHSLQSVAVGHPGGAEELYVGEFDEERQTGAVDAFGPDVVLPDVTTAPASPASLGGEGQIEATLNGTVNPLGKGEAKCDFAWGTSKAFGQPPAPCEPEGVPDGNAPALVHAAIKGLAPGTTYFFRLQASNANGTNPGEESQDRELLTPGPGLHGESASEVSSTAATLNATIDPHGTSTSYYFQYATSSTTGCTASSCASTPAPPGTALGSGVGDVQVAPRHVQGLAPSTVYHYRVVVVSQLEVKGTPTAVSFAGPDQTFTTQGAGGALTLPDARQWELVSPPDKHGALLLPIGGGGVIQASASGGMASYGTNLPTEERVKGYMFLGVQVLSSREPGGWSSQDVSLPHVEAAGLPTASGNEYQFFSPDLSAALVEPQGAKGEFTSLAPEAFPPDTERTPYVRHNSRCAATPASCFQPLLTSAPGYADVPEGTKFGGEFHSDASFVGATPDLAHAILGSGLALTATSTSSQALYEWSAGKAPAEQLQLVSVLPGGEASNAAAQLGFANRVARHAVSDDGSRIFWSEFEGGRHLYLRDTAKRQTVQLDAPQAQCLAKEECGDGVVSPRFNTATRDGSRVLFTDTQRLSKDSGVVPKQADLYECVIVEEMGKLHCELSDLTPSPGGGEAADVLGGVIGASEDGSWAYFVANGVLGDGAEHDAVHGDCEVSSATGKGTCNLYAWHDGTTHLVAVVAGEDYPDWDGEEADLNQLTARVSPDGRWLAFMSQRSLTGYDNHDAFSGKPDEEVYLYHAEAAGSGSLACASCDPSGGRPVGVEYAKLNGETLVGGFNVWSRETWIAANVPGWTPYRQSAALYQSRYLSDEGRLLFNSRDALVAQDINNDQDVYQYEPAGVGDCASSSPTFSQASASCVGLISSGRAAGESAFLDASESGGDVFFLSGERLVAKDVDTALDVYDAHVCTSGAPCISETTPPPPCETAEACRSAPTPQPGIFGSPSSATFSGQGNLPPPARKPGLTRKQQLAKALSACRKRYQHSKKRRSTCEKQARKRYGAKKARKTNLDKTAKR